MDFEQLKRRTKDFAHRCVKLALALPDTKLGRHIQGQLIRCSTAVAANYRATCLAQTKAVFASEVSIVIEVPAPPCGVALMCGTFQILLPQIPPF
jgi:hypothetical protein